MVRKSFPIKGLRTIALLILVAGAAGSMIMMYRVGQNNKSVLLLALFTAWVLSPFIALFVASRAFRHRSASAVFMLYILMLVLSLVSLIGYSGILSPEGTKPAFVFLLVPLLSWIVIAIIIPMAAARSRKDKEKI